MSKVFRLYSRSIMDGEKTIGIYDSKDKANEVLLKLERTELISKEREHVCLNCYNKKHNESIRCRNYKELSDPEKYYGCKNYREMTYVSPGYMIEEVNIQ